MSHILAIANQKGGVGKTTTAVNLAAALHEARRKVLLIDVDPQGNATVGCGVDKDELEPNGCAVLLEECDITEAIHATPAGFDLIPGNSDLTAAEVKLMDAMAREHRLREMLQAVEDTYDFILIDCPPSLNLLTINALTAADGVIVTMQCEYFALEGLSALSNTIAAVQARLNPNLEVAGILRTMFDGRNNLASDVADQLKEHFGDRLYRTVIPRNVRLAEAPSHGQTILQYDRSSRGGMAYTSLAGEVIRQFKTKKH